VTSVGIIIPSWHYFVNPFKLQPLYELYYATVIDAHFQNDDVKVNVIDLRELRFPDKKNCWDNIASYVGECHLYLYWITKSADYNEIISVVQQLRFAYPEARHVVGGTVKNLLLTLSMIPEAIHSRMYTSPIGDW